MTDAFRPSLLFINCGVSPSLQVAKVMMKDCHGDRRGIGGEEEPGRNSEEQDGQLWPVYVYGVC